MRDFKNFFGTATTSRGLGNIENYVTRDPSEPPMLHQFRTERKGNWMSRDGFKLV